MESQTEQEVLSFCLCVCRFCLSEQTAHAELQWISQCQYLFVSVQWTTEIERIHCTRAHAVLVIWRLVALHYQPKASGKPTCVQIDNKHRAYEHTRTETHTHTKWLVCRCTSSQPQMYTDKPVRFNIRKHARCSFSNRGCIRATATAWRDFRDWGYNAGQWAHCGGKIRRRLFVFC